MSSFYSKEELENIGFKSYGKNLQISKKASIYSAEKISIGDNVRIDDFSLLSGRITIGSNIHIAAGVMLYGAEAGITIGDYSTISSRGAVYALTDDYSGEYMTNPTIPRKYTGVTEKEVIIGKHVIVGTGCTILSGVRVGDGTSIGAMSLINRDTEEWSIYYGIPAKKQCDRSRELLKLCEQFESEKNDE